VTQFIPWNEGNTLEGVAPMMPAMSMAAHHTLNFRRFVKK